MVVKATSLLCCNVFLLVTIKKKKNWASQNDTSLPIHDPTCDVPLIVLFDVIVLIHEWYDINVVLQVNFLGDMAHRSLFLLSYSPWSGVTVKPQRTSLGMSLVVGFVVCCLGRVVLLRVAVPVHEFPRRVAFVVCFCLLGCVGPKLRPSHVYPGWSVFFFLFLKCLLPACLCPPE